MTRINGNFHLSKIKDGAKQKSVLTQLLLVSRLSEVVLVHFIEQGSSDYNFFTSVNTTAIDYFPRIYLFSPKTVLQNNAPQLSLLSLPVLYDRLLTPTSLYNYVISSLQLPTM